MNGIAGLNGFRANFPYANDGIDFSHSLTTRVPSTLCSMSLGDDDLVAGGGNGRRSGVWSASGTPKTFKTLNIPDVRVKLHTTPSALATSLQDSFLTPVQTTEFLPQNTSATAGGRLHILGGESNIDITEIPADITIVPRWHASTENGGGEIGGVAQAWINQSLTRDEEEQTQIQRAVTIYSEIRDVQVGYSLPLGAVVTGKTVSNETQSVPQYFINISSVPGMNLRKAGSASQKDRIEFVETLMKSVLLEIQKIVLQDPALKSRTSDNPIVISLPALNTGNQGAVSLEELAIVVLKVLGPFLQSHPEIDLIMPLYDAAIEGVPAESNEIFKKILAGDIEAISHVKAPVLETSRTLFQRTMNSVTTPDRKTGKAFSNKTFAPSFDAWKSSFSQKVAQLSSDDLQSRQKGMDQFQNVADALVFHIAHKIVTVENQFGANRSTDAAPLVTTDQILQLIADQRFLSASYQMIRSELDKTKASKNFAGEHLLPELIAAVIGIQLTNLYYERMTQIEETLKIQLTTGAGILSEIQRRFKLKENEVQDLIVKLSQKDANIAELASQTTKSKKKIAQLETELRTARQALEDARNRHATYTATTSYASESRVSSGESHSYTAPVSGTSSSFSGGGGGGGGGESRGSGGESRYR